MEKSSWLRALAVLAAILVVGAPDAALITISAISVLAIMGLVVSLAFETVCEADRQRSRGGRTLPAKPDRAVRAGALPVARVVGEPVARS